MTISERPVPVPDEMSSPYWKAASEHVLTIAKCSRCGWFTHPPDVMCLHCGRTDPDFVFTPVSGAGVIRSWTVMHQSFLPGFDEDLPFVLVDVEIVEQEDLRLIGRLVDGPGAPIQIGSRVQVTFEDLRPGISVPAFALTGAQ